METMTKARRRPADTLPSLERVADTPAARAVWQLMRRAGITSARALSQRISANDGYISDLFDGKLRAPGADYAQALANVFNVSVEVVLGTAPMPEDLPLTSENIAARLGIDWDPELMASVYPIAEAALQEAEGSGHGGDDKYKGVFRLIREFSEAIEEYVAAGGRLDPPLRNLLRSVMGLYLTRHLKSPPRPKSVKDA